MRGLCGGDRGERQRKIEKDRETVLEAKTGRSWLYCNEFFSNERTIVWKKIERDREAETFKITVDSTV